MNVYLKCFNVNLHGKKELSYHVYFIKQSPVSATVLHAVEILAVEVKQL